VSDLKIADTAGQGWDLVLEDGDVVLFGPDDTTAEVAQRVVYTVMTWQGESPYDLAAGLPYLDGIFGFEPVPGVAGLITQAIQDTEGVAEVDENPSYLLETTTRELSMSVRIRVTGDPAFTPISLEVSTP
jgi:hypothetical protein